MSKPRIWGGMGCRAPRLFPTSPAQPGLCLGAGVASKTPGNGRDAWPWGLCSRSPRICPKSPLLSIVSPSRKRSSAGLLRLLPDSGCMKLGWRLCLGWGAGVPVCVRCCGRFLGDRVNCRGGGSAGRIVLCGSVAVSAGSSWAAFQGWRPGKAEYLLESER